jgi:flagellar hook-basal body complex protein FliE
MIDPVSVAVAFPLESSKAATAAAGRVGDFSTWLTQQVLDLNTQLTHASTEVRQLAVGESVNVHQVMIDLEKAKLSLQLLVQVRNKLMEAYQSVMQMQV